MTYTHKITHCTRCNTSIPPVFIKKGTRLESDITRRDLCYDCFEWLVNWQLERENKMGCWLAFIGLVSFVVFLWWISIPKAESMGIHAPAIPKSVNQLDWLQAHGYTCQRQADNTYYCL
jgi:hypothetical protein